MAITGRALALVIGIVLVIGSLALLFSISLVSVLVSNTCGPGCPEPGAGYLTGWIVFGTTLVAGLAISLWASYRMGKASSAPTQDGGQRRAISAMDGPVKSPRSVLKDATND